MNFMQQWNCTLRLVIHIIFAGGFSMNKQKLVLIGNGMPGIRCIEEILENDADLFTITVFGREPHVNYNRILLSTVLQGSTSFEDITINNRDWYEENNIQLFTGETVVKVDTENKIVK